MHFRRLLQTLSPFLILTTPTTAQTLSTLPQCLQTCINKYSSNCAESDVACICRLSSTSFLTPVVNCYATTCTPTDAINIVLSALDSLCVLASAPIPSAALSSAYSAANSALAAASSAVAAASSTAAIVVGGYTTSDGGLVGVFPSTTIRGGVVTTTIIAVETDSAGVTQTLEIPEVYGPSTTVLGAPVVVTGTESVTPARPTAVPLGGTASTSLAQQGTTTATVTEQSQSTAGTTSETSGSTLSGTTAAGATSSGANGSPFTGQSGGWKIRMDSWLICIGMLIVGMVWY